MFLNNTIEDILKNKEDETEIIAVIDGNWNYIPLKLHPDVKVIYLPESIGQRAATNVGVRISKAKWVMKVDSHCSFDKGFDRKMIEAFEKVGDMVTMVPTMRNLHVFDWKCNYCGWKKYQGPTPLVCPECGRKDKIRRKIVWIGKRNPQSNSFCFDSTPHFQYWNEYTKRECYKKELEETGLTESMSIQGSCFALTREKYLELNICDESVGSWGNQAIEVACKTWLSGGKILINHNTWFSHLFRTAGGDFGFPYPMSDKQVQKTKSLIRDLFFNNKWDKQIYPLSWLINKFAPIKGWSDDDIRMINETPFKKNVL